MSDMTEKLFMLSSLSLSPSLPYPSMTMDNTIIHTVTFISHPYQLNTETQTNSVISNH